MPRCEDYPCCGHGPAPHGDGGGCPDSQGRFDCVICGSKLPKGNSRSICNRCMNSHAFMYDDRDLDYPEDERFDY